MKHEMIDVLEKNSNVEIHIALDGRVWVNVNGACILRINRTEDLVLHDERKMEHV